MSAAATSHAGALGESKDAFLRLHGVALGYRGSAVLHDLSFALHVGEVLALVGANGCGKTTLLRALAGLAVPLAGEIDWDSGRSMPIRSSVIRTPLFPWGSSMASAFPHSSVDFPSAGCVREA